jgi:C-terminal processing protease CtpA/Prc
VIQILQTVVPLTHSARSLERRALPFILALATLAIPPSGRAQGPGDRYTIGATLVGAHDTCPIFVKGVGLNSPAGRAGILPGDQLLTVNGTDVSHLDLRQTTELMRSVMPGTLSLTLLRGAHAYKVAVEPEKQSSVRERE